MEQFRRSPEHDDPSATKVDQELLRRGIRFNTILLALVMGIVAGLGIFVFTHLSILITGERAGRYLNLLAIFFPGYRATPEGAWLGLIWGFVAGATAGGFIYYAYARAMGADLASKVARGSGPDQIIEQPVLRMSGHALGLALGLLMALQLFLATVWLMVAGSGEKSPHAILLAEYLPGYSVNLLGGIIGAVDIFIFTYGLSRLLAWVYNRVVSLRSQEGSR
jgi:hypothetical protein